MLKKSYIIHNGKELEVNADFLIGKKQVKNDFDQLTIIPRVIVGIIVLILVIFFLF
jgi:hypothetical protein